MNAEKWLADPTTCSDLPMHLFTNESSTKLVQAAMDAAQAEMREQLHAAEDAIEVLKGDLARMEAGEHEQAAIATALREVSDLAEDEVFDLAGRRKSNAVRDAILALISPEQQSALDRHDAKIREENKATELEWEKRYVRRGRELSEMEHTHKLALLRAVRDEAKWWHHYQVESEGHECEVYYPDCVRLAATQRAIEEAEANAKTNDLPGR